MVIHAGVECSSCNHKLRVCFVVPLELVDATATDEQQQRKPVVASGCSFRPHVCINLHTQPNRQRLRRQSNNRIAAWRNLSSRVATRRRRRRKQKVTNDCVAGGGDGHITQDIILLTSAKSHTQICALASKSMMNSTSDDDEKKNKRRRICINSPSLS